VLQLRIKIHGLLTEIRISNGRPSHELGGVAKPGLPAGFGLVLYSLWVTWRGLRRRFREDYLIMDLSNKTDAAISVQFVGNVIYYGYRAYPNESDQHGSCTV
jgi:hypothetical protein